MTTTTTYIYRDGIRFELGSESPYATGYGLDDGPYATARGVDGGLPVVRYWDCLRQVWAITYGGIGRDVVATLQPEEWAAIQAHCGPRPGCRRQ